MIAYLLEVAVLQLVLLLLYFLLIKKETALQFQRSYLLLTMLLALLVPLLSISMPATGNGTAIDTEYELALSPSMIGDASQKMSDKISKNGFYFDNASLLEQIYLGSIMISVLLLLIGVTRVILLKLKSRRRDYKGHTLIEIQGTRQSFSFLTWVFVQKDAPKAIIEHELAHVKLYHTLDNIILQLFKSFFWWTPGSWMVIKELRLIHEFQADAYAVKQSDFHEYKEVLIRTSLNSIGLSLASSFHHGSILRRLNTMSKQTHNIPKWKISTLGVLVALTVLVFSCSEELGDDIKKMTEMSSSVSYADLPSRMQEKYPEKPGDRYFVFYVENMGEDNSQLKFNIDEENNTGIVLPSGKRVKNLQDIDPGMIKALDVQREERNPDIGRVYMILSEDNTVVERMANAGSDQDEVFTVVEEQPEFPGGSTELYRIIGERLKYPKEARKQGIEGRVFIQFVIDETGQVTNVKPVKGIGAGCDEAAANVIAELPAFIPGKQRGKNVKVRMVLPVIFTLDGDEPQEKSTITIEEVPVGDKGQE